MKNLYGWTGTVLHINLSSRKITRIPTANFEPEKFIGGVGLSAKIFWDMGCPNVAALDMESPFIISTGPLTGLPGPFNRAEICGIGAQNYPEEQFTYSGIGGNFPSQLKYAGYDAIVILGKAKQPVYLSIQDDDVEIKDANSIWGLDLIETQRVLKNNDPKASVLAIGPAGENLCRCSVVATDTGSTAGQGGFGAVLGSKNLKAIRVKGSGKINIAKPDGFLKLITEMNAKGSWSKGAAQRWARAPLCGGEVGKELTKTYRIKFSGPYGCPYQCMGFYDVPGIGKGAAMCASWWYGFLRQEPEAAKAVWEANMFAQKLGINHFELLALIMIVAESIFEGIATPDEWIGVGVSPLPEILGGPAKDHDFLTTMLLKISEGNSPFSHGILRARDHILEGFQNKEEIKKLIEIKFPAWGYAAHYYGWLGLCLHVALDTRDSGNSTDGYLALNRDNVNGIPLDILGKHFGVPYGPSTFAHAEGTSDVEAVWEGIEYQTAWEIDNQQLRNSLPICNFASLPDAYFHPPEMDIRIFESKVFSLVTGINLDPGNLARTGERIWNMRRAIMVKRENRSREKDTYLDSFFNTRWPDIQDGSGGDLYEFTAFIDKNRFEALKDRFYILRGWDVGTGRPTRSKLEELGLKDVADVLEKTNNLS